MTRINDVEPDIYVWRKLALLKFVSYVGVCALFVHVDESANVICYIGINGETADKQH